MGSGYSMSDEKILYIYNMDKLYESYIIQIYVNVLAAKKCFM